MKHLPKHDGSKFDWSTGIGIADVSDFRGRLTGRVYPDAADSGFVVRSHRTGVEKVFVESRTVRANSGETMYWEFESTDEARNIVRIYND